MANTTANAEAQLVDRPRLGDVGQLERLVPERPRQPAGDARQHDQPDGPPRHLPDVAPPAHDRDRHAQRRQHQQRLQAQATKTSVAFRADLLSTFTIAANAAPAKPNTSHLYWPMATS